MTRKAPKAYKNSEFLNSSQARTIRILSEYLEPESRLREMNVHHTIVFFGSARSVPENGSEIHKRSYRAAEELAFLLSTHSNSRTSDRFRYYICTGGGPGIMEAANRGAARAKSRTIGFNISLPFEQVPNEYISPELNFEFHYFFMRKLWFLYHAKAIVVFPGGFGTLDELFETLTLVQTEKLEHGKIPILLYDRKFWDSLIDFNVLADYGMISPEDLELITFFSSPEEGFNILAPHLEKEIDDFNNLHPTTCL